MSHKIILTWVGGSVLIFLSIWMLSNLEKTIGVSEITYALMVFMSFILVLLGGFLWISTAVSSREKKR